jgi:hypothetical protein
MSDNPRFGYMLDGKLVKKYLFTRWMIVAQAHKLVMVEGFDKDHAMKRLLEHYTGSELREWEFIDEVPPEAFIGPKMGDTLDLIPYSSREGALTWRQ